MSSDDHTDGEISVHETPDELRFEAYDAPAGGWGALQAVAKALREQSITFDVNASGDAVSVRPSQTTQARMLLAEKGLPTSASAGYELFDKIGSLGLTSFMQEVTKLRALEGEIARTVQLMKGVKAARIHIVLPVRGSFRGTQQPPSASIVLRTDGTTTVGAWNREVRMTPNVASVRQNLVPLLDDGQVNPSCRSGGTAEWGSTVGQVAFIHRSGFGITADGGEVYVGGPALSVCSLGQILQASGVVRGMELDINPNWVSGAYFHPSLNGLPEAFRLFPGEKVAAEHYFSPSSRDWYAYYARP